MPPRPTGFTSSTDSPSWSLMADTIACPRRPPDVQVGGLASPVRHGEQVVGREPAEQRHPDRHAEDRTGSRIGRVIDAQVDAGDPEREQRDADHPLGDRSRAPGHDQGVGGADDRDGEARERPRRHRVPLPSREDRDAERSGTGDDDGGVIGHDLGRDDRAEEHEQVPPPAEHDQAEDHAPPDQADRPAGPEPVDDQHHAGESGGPEIGDPALPGVVPALEERLERREQQEADEGEREVGNEEEEELPRPAELSWERGRFAGRSAVRIRGTEILHPTSGTLPDVRGSAGRVHRSDRRLYSSRW